MQGTYRISRKSWCALVAQTDEINTRLVSLGRLFLTVFENPVAICYCIHMLRNYSRPGQQIHLMGASCDLISIMPPCNGPLSIHLSD